MICRSNWLIGSAQYIFSGLLITKTSDLPWIKQLTSFSRFGFLIFKTNCGSLEKQMTLTYFSKETFSRYLQKTCFLTLSSVTGINLDNGWSNLRKLCFAQKVSSSNFRLYILFVSMGLKFFGLQAIKVKKSAFFDLILKSLTLCCSIEIDFRRL